MFLKFLLGHSFDLASMMQVSLVAFIVAGALLPVTYVDFLYQVLGLIGAMQVMVEKYSRKEAADVTGARHRIDDKRREKGAAIASNAGARRPLGLRPSPRLKNKPQSVKDLPNW